MNIRFRVPVLVWTVVLRGFFSRANLRGIKTSARINETLAWEW